MSKWKAAILIILAVLLIAGSTGFCVYYFIYVQSDAPTLVYEGEELESGANVGQLPSGAAFTLLGGSDAEVRIEGYGTEENDFGLTVGGTEYLWSDFSGRDMTAGFTVERSGIAGYETLTISYEGFEEIVRGSIGTALTVTAGEITDAWFRLVLEPYDTEIYFSVGIEGKIEVVPAQIIF